MRVTDAITHAEKCRRRTAARQRALSRKPQRTAGVLRQGDFQPIDWTKPAERTKPATPPSSFVFISNADALAIMQYGARKRRAKASTTTPQAQAAVVDQLPATGTVWQRLRQKLSDYLKQLTRPSD